MVGYDVHAPKRALNLSLNEDLLRQAKQKRRLEKELQQTLETWNAFRAEHGSPVDEYLEL